MRGRFEAVVERLPESVKPNPEVRFYNPRELAGARVRNDLITRPAPVRMRPGNVPRQPNPSRAVMRAPEASAKEPSANDIHKGKRKRAESPETPRPKVNPSAYASTGYTAVARTFSRP